MGTQTAVSQAKYENMILVMSHMRGATTALSNVLCSHESISGYGETHVAYRKSFSPGQLVVNQYRRDAWKSEASYLFDKLLHNRLDGTVPDSFFKARAIFMVRAPKASVSSIVKLALETGMSDVDTPLKAANYYSDRLERLTTLWNTFEPKRRFGMVSENLLSDPETELQRVSDWLALTPRLKNSYASHPATQAHGGGDPTVSAKLTKIESRPTSPDTSEILGIPSQVSVRCLKTYERLIECFTKDGA